MPVPLTPDERKAVETDLADVRVYEALLAPLGVKGLVVMCDDCRHDHYPTWHELLGNLESLRDTGDVAHHPENATRDPHGYASWDWCRGYLAGLTRDVERWGPTTES
ncbi:hypothetical protein BO226_11105 [Rhodococcus sp. 2G]|uniref:DUF5319 family protein n=1 Tax=Rhodococcus sp. 2G TaxID=1570939 RepID=UPI000909ED36|nr:DUF5319 family protein [Rhodococcus sp. 2G]APE09682.1 hypothetical protein BO226_11105 [Rhodococcus sp. 2G]